MQVHSRKQANPNSTRSNSSKSIEAALYAAASAGFMERLGLAVLVAVPLFVFSAAACAGSHRVESAAPIAEIGEMRAKQQVIERYRSLFADKYLLNLADNTYVTFPPVTERDFNRVELQGAVWSLKVDPPMGVSIVARVARDGSWTEIVDVGYASE